MSAEDRVTLFQPVLTGLFRAADNCDLNSSPTIISILNNLITITEDKHIAEVRNSSYRESWSIEERRQNIQTHS